MLDYIRKNIVKQIPKVVSALKKIDTVTLKDLSNHTIHSASVYQDKSSLVFALTVYSLSKIVERCKGSENFDIFLGKVIKDLQDSKDLLVINNIGAYKKKRNSILISISKIDSKFKYYIEEVIDKARIKKGSKLYEHGVSIRRVADILGITQWELMNYIGKTKTKNFREPAVKIKDRIIFTRKIFGMG